MAALGLIETLGLVGAIEGADAMLKAADVRLLEKNLAGGGLVTITVSGEVAAVHAAVDAAQASIARLSGATLVSRQVIARPDPEVAAVVSLEVSPPPSDMCQDDEDDEPVEDPSCPAEDGASAEATRYEAGQLKKLNVAVLRSHAASLPGMSLSREDIDAAPRKTLIQAIMNAYRTIEE